MIFLRYIFFGNRRFRFRVATEISNLLLAYYHNTNWGHDNDLLIALAAVQLQDQSTLNIFDQDTQDSAKASELQTAPSLYTETSAAVMMKSVSEPVPVYNLLHEELVASLGEVVGVPEKELAGVPARVRRVAVAHERHLEHPRSAAPPVRHLESWEHGDRLGNVVADSHFGSVRCGSP